MTSLAEIKKPINAEFEEFNKRFKTSFKSNVPLLNLITKYILKRKGKQMRPILVFLSANILGKTNDSTYIAASLIELLHTATLIHDDVVDDAHFRRNHFSINALWKSKVAVLLGDYLLAKGLLISINNDEFELLKIVSEAVEEMSEGELLQIQKTRKLNLSEEEYFDIIRKKTATLIGACTACGAQSVGADVDTVLKMKSFGEYIGIAFQIKDDLLDYSQNGSTGKTAGNDIENKKLTLPLIYSLSKANKSEKSSIIRKVKQKNKKNFSDIMNFINKYEGLTYSEGKINEYKDKAFEILKELPNNQFSESMKSLIDFVSSRKK